MRRIRIKMLNKTQCQSSTDNFEHNSSNLDTQLQLCLLAG